MVKIKGWKLEMDTTNTTYWYQKPSKYVEINWDGWDYRLDIIDNNKVLKSVKSSNKKFLRDLAIEHMRLHPNG